MATTLSIVSSLKGLDNQIYYTEAFRNQVENALQLLIYSNKTQAKEIDAVTAYQFEGDFNGLCNALSIPPHLHYTVMRMSGLTSSEEMHRDLKQVLIPDPNQLSQMVSTFSTLPSNFIPAPDA